MQDGYIGDIGDYGKYGLLREVTAAGLTLSVNWYRVILKKIGKQDDGKYIHYLAKPDLYRACDAALFDSLHEIVCKENNRTIERIEHANLFHATFFSKEIGTDRNGWHREALERTAGADVVFLDPDNGLETRKMNQKGSAKEKHVKWSELRDYYDRGQSVILYQHRPQMMKAELCIESVLSFQRDYLRADHVMLLEFPKCTNRFYFMFLHENYREAFQKVCSSTISKWGKKIRPRDKKEFCREIILA